MFCIRNADLKDLAEIVIIYNQAIAATGKTADTEPVDIDNRNIWFDDHNQDKYPIIVAEEDGIVIGYLSISAYRPGRLALAKTAEVSYFVHFEHHGKGVGTKLLEFAIKICPSLNIKNLFSILMENNQASINLLEKFSFKRWGHLPNVAEYNGVEVGQYYYGRSII